MLNNFYKAKRYIEIIFKFILILFERDGLVFIVINLLGILAKSMVMIAFLFSVKAAYLIYQDTLLVFLNSFAIEWMQGLTSSMAYTITATLVFLIFMV